MTPEPAQPAGACICDAACPMTEDRHWINCPAHKYYANYLALQPAQPAESPGALLAHLQRMPMTEWVWTDAQRIFAVLAASTARPTERGAVEGWARSQALWDAAQECLRVRDETTFANSVSEDYREGYKAACVIASMPLQAMSRRAAPEWSGTSADTAPATDQAAEVDEARIREIATIIYGEVSDEPLGDLTQRRDAVQTQWYDAVRSALATQPATGRTMGGEDGLREALKPFAAIPLDGHNTPDGYPDPRLWRSHLVAARAALQNGGE